MAYNEKLAERISNILKGKRGIAKKKMFGGIAFMYKDRMFCGIVKDDLMVRVQDDKYEGYLKKPHVREMDFTGRPLKGYLYVDPGGIKTEKQLSKWIDEGIEYVLNSRQRRKRQQQNRQHAKSELR